MTQEEKQLLLNDLSARLLYGVFIHYHWSREGNTIDEDRELDFSDVETLKYNIENPQNDWCEISWKPYLRPMSSMTKEENEEYNGLLYRVCDFTQDASNPMPVIELTTFFYSHHLDCCGLIEKGLANAMYKEE